MTYSSNIDRLINSLLLLFFFNLWCDIVPCYNLNYLTYPTSLTLYSKRTGISMDNPRVILVLNEVAFVKWVKYLVLSMQDTAFFKSIRIELSSSSSMLSPAPGLSVTDPLPISPSALKLTPSLVTLTVTLS